MKRMFMDLLIKDLVEKKDYTLLRDENGRIPENRGSRILQRVYYGTYSILEILDGDSFSAEEIRARLSKNTDILLSINRDNTMFFQVILFSSSPTQEKLEAIEEGQYQKYPGKKFLACISASLEDEKVEKHYRLPMSSGGLEKAIAKVMKEKWQDNHEIVDLEELVQTKESARPMSFSADKPYLSYALIALNIVVFLAIYVYGMQSNEQFHLLLDRFGAKNNLSILSGEYWRLVTPIFLHADIMHLLVNCYSIYAVGFFVERLFGHGKFAVVYFIAGIMGNIASFMFSINNGVGASGAIFGLLGALLYYGLENPAQFRRSFGYNVIFMIVLNVFIGFTQSRIDNFAHIGGLVGGFLAAGVISSRKLSIKYLNRSVFVVLTLALLAGGLYYGFNLGQNAALKKVPFMEKQAEENKWAQVEGTAEEILQSRITQKGLRLQALFYAAQAEAELGKYEEAIGHGKEVLAIDAGRGHYILGILYFNTAQYDKAKEELLEAKALRVGLEDVDEILKRIEEISRQ